MRSQTVANQLRQEISRGRYQPGEKLNEVQLAERLDVSRNTLREGFAELASQGLVTRIHHRGVFIAKPTVADVADFYTARAFIEPNALRTADVDVPRLSTIVAAAEKALEEGDLAKVADANQRFHRVIVAGVGSSMVEDMMDRILALMRLAFLQVLEAEPEFHAPFVAKNREVMDALERMDFNEAADILEDSLISTPTAVQKYLSH